MIHALFSAFNDVMAVLAVIGIVVLEWSWLEFFDSLYLRVRYGTPILSD